MNLNNRYLYWLFFVLLIFLAGCRTVVPAATSTNTQPQSLSTTQPPVMNTTPVASATATASIIPTLVPSWTSSPSPTRTLTPSPTPDPYFAYTVDALSGRSYGGGRLQVEETLAENSYFVRQLFSYPSDDLTIYGFLNVPKTGEGPFPVIVALHGYIDPDIYNTIDYTTRYADALARAGFLVLHPNLRGYPPSDDGGNLFRVGMAVDVLNLIAIVKEEAGQPGPFENADSQSIGLWGHSMGGGIATRVMVVSPEVKAVVLYGAMSGDDQRNYERIFTYFSNGSRGLEELEAPAAVFERVSPINFLDRVKAAVSIHHGKEDPDVPLAWSLDLCGRLQAIGKSADCFTYAGQGHTFHGDGDELFMQRVELFFRQMLKP